MGLALLLWALAVLLSQVRDRDGQTRLELASAGAALGLSVAANLIFLVPAVMMVGLVLVLSGTRESPGNTATAPTSDRAKKGRKKARAIEERRSGAGFWRYFVLPAAGVATAFFLTAPLDKATSGSFYVGSSKIVESLRNLSEVSLAHSGPWRKAAVTSRCIDAVAFCIAPAALLGAIAVGLRGRSPLLLLTSGTAVGAMLVLIFIHLAFQFPYPVDRTGIYFLALAPLALVGLAETGIAGARPARAGALVAYALAVAFAFQYVMQFNTRKFLVWEYDADTRRIVDRISRSVLKKQPDSVRVSSSWQLEPSLNFYRDKYRLAWMRPVARAPVAPGGDYYVLLDQDRGAVNTLGLQVVYEGEISGTILAVPSR
jgi:hypothetical protein